MQLRDLHCWPQLNRRVGKRQLRNARLELPAPERRRFRAILRPLRRSAGSCRSTSFWQKHSPRTLYIHARTAITRLALLMKAPPNSREGR